MTINKTKFYGISDKSVFSWDIYKKSYQDSAYFTEVSIYQILPLKLIIDSSNIIHYAISWHDEFFERYSEYKKEDCILIRDSCIWFSKKLTEDTINLLLKLNQYVPIKYVNDILVNDNLEQLLLQ